MKKRLTAAFLTLCLMLTLLPVTAWAAETAGGQWGDSTTVRWSYDESTKTLTVSGTGAIPDGVVGDNSEMICPYQEYRDKIDKVVIEDGITSIGKNAFEYCSLTSVSFPTTLKEIGDYAFYGCESLTEVTLPDSVTTLGFCAFSKCSSLKKVELSKNITSWKGGEEPSSREGWTFSECTALTQVTVPEGVTSIGEAAFSGCISLTRIELPSSILSIETLAFEYCNFVQFSFPNGIKSISYDVFGHDAIYLSSIYIPASVETVSLGTLSSYKNLRNIYYGGSQQQWDSLKIDLYSEDIAVHYGEDGLPDNTVRDAEGLQDKIDNSPATMYEWVEIQLTKDIDITDPSQVITVPNGHYIRIDLNGHYIKSVADPVISVKGRFQVVDNTVSCNMEVQPEAEVPVDCTSVGYITTGDTDKHDAVVIQDNGSFAMYSGMIQATNSAVSVRGGDANKVSAAFYGGYLDTVESAVAVFGPNATIEIERGVMLSRNNAVITGSELPEYAGTKIIMLSGTLISRSKTLGHIPCGIYHPQQGNLEIQNGYVDKGGHTGIYAEGGVGILMRGGSLTLPKEQSGKQQVTIFTGDDTSKSGKVGNAALQIEAGHPVVLDQKSGYYDSYNITYLVSANVEKRPDELEPDALKRTLEELSKWNAPKVYIADKYDLDPVGRAEGASYAQIDYSFKWVGGYAVTFNFHNGEENIAIVTAPDGTFPSDQWPADPTRAGYTFKGWYTSENGDTTISAADKFTQDKVVHAQWTPQEHTVNFDLNYTGATGAPANQTIATDSKVTQPAQPARSGYTFGGWYKEAACKTKWNFEYDTVKEPMTLYAKWTDNTVPVYTVNFETNGGSAVPSQTVAKGETVERPAAPTKGGYLFDGWYKEVACMNPWRFDTDTVTGDTVLYAKWKEEEPGPTEPEDPDKKTYTVTFDANGGTVTPATAVTGTDGKLQKWPEPARTGYTFNGWYTAATGGTKVSEDYVFTANTTVYAQWTQNTSPSETQYRIYTPGSVTGGSYDVSHTRAAEGTRITIEIDPRSGYELDWIEACNIDTGRSLTLTERYDSEYTFTMPASDVELDLGFYRRNSSSGNTSASSRPASNQGNQAPRPVQSAPTVTKPVQWYYSNGAIYHVNSGLVPNGSAFTRDMLVSVLYNLDSTSSGEPLFWATNNAIVPDIYLSWLWGVDKSISREQTVMILYCYAKHKNYNTLRRVLITSYKDYDEIRPLARPAMSWAKAAGLMNGTSATTLSPQRIMTCGEASVVLTRFLNNTARIY